MLHAKKWTFLAVSSLTEQLQQLAQYLGKQLRAKKISTLFLPSAHRDTLEVQWNRYDEMGIPYHLLLNEKTLRNGILHLRSRDTTLKVCLVSRVAKRGENLSGICCVAGTSSCLRVAKLCGEVVWKLLICSWFSFLIKMYIFNIFKLKIVLPACLPKLLHSFTRCQKFTFRLKNNNGNNSPLFEIDVNFVLEIFWHFFASLE